LDAYHSYESFKYDSLYMSHRKFCTGRGTCEIDLFYNICDKREFTPTQKDCVGSSRKEVWLIIPHSNNSDVIKVDESSLWLTQPTTNYVITKTNPFWYRMRLIQTFFPFNQWRHHDDYVMIINYVITHHVTNRGIRAQI